MASRATEHHRLACMAAATQRTRPLPTRILRRALPILAAELTVGRSPIRLAAKHPSIPSGLAGLGEAALDPKPAVGAGLARLVPDLLVEPATRGEATSEHACGNLRSACDSDNSF